MPVDIKLDLKNKIVYSKGTGKITNADIVEYPSKLKTFPDFTPDFHHLFDLKEVEEIKVKTKMIYEVIQISIFSPTSKRAIIAHSSNYFNILRMYELINDPRKKRVQIFQTVKEAYKWISSTTDTI